jgi:hypothetical protein
MTDAESPPTVPEWPYTKVCTACGVNFMPADGRQKRCEKCRPERWRGFRVYEGELLTVLAATAVALDQLQDAKGQSPADHRELAALMTFRERLRSYLMWKQKQRSRAPSWADREAEEQTKG